MSPWPIPCSCTLWVPLQSCLARFTIIFTECVSNPAKFALSYLLIDVYLTSHFPQLFIASNPGPPDLHDISQASVYRRLKLSLNFTCNQPGLASVQQYRFYVCIEKFHLCIIIYIMCQPYFSQSSKSTSGFLDSGFHILTCSFIFWYSTSKICKIMYSW
jgi:hypothetical protein